MQAWWHKKGRQDSGALKNYAQAMLNALKTRMNISGLSSASDRVVLEDGTEIRVAWAMGIPSVFVTFSGRTESRMCQIYMESGMLDLGAASGSTRYGYVGVFDSAPATLHFGSNMTCEGFGGINGGVELRLNGETPMSVASQCLGKSGSTAVTSRVNDPAKKRAQAVCPASVYSGLLRRYVAAIYGASYVDYTLAGNNLVIDGREIYASECNGYGALATLDQLSISFISIVDGDLFFGLQNARFSSGGNRVVDLYLVPPAFKTDCHRYVYEAWRALAASSITTPEGVKLLALAMSGMIPGSTYQRLFSATRFNDGWSANADGTKIAYLRYEDDYDGYATTEFYVDVSGVIQLTLNTFLNPFPRLTSDVVLEAQRSLAVNFEFASDKLAHFYLYTKDENVQDETPFAQCNQYQVSTFPPATTRWDTQPWWIRLLTPFIPSTERSALYPGGINCTDRARARDRTHGVVKKTDGVVEWSTTELLAGFVDGGGLMATFLGAPVVTVHTGDDNGLGSPDGGDNVDCVAVQSPGSTPETAYTAFSFQYWMYEDYGCGSYLADNTASSPVCLSKSATIAEGCAPVICDGAAYGGVDVVYTSETEFTQTVFQSFACNGVRRRNLRDVSLQRTKTAHEVYIVQSGERHNHFSGVYELGKSIYAYPSKYTRSAVKGKCVHSNPGLCPPFDGASPSGDYTVSAGAFYGGSATFNLFAPAASIDYNVGMSALTEDTIPRTQQIQRGGWVDATIKTYVVYPENTQHTVVRDGAAKTINVSDPTAIAYYTPNPLYDPAGIDLSGSPCAQNLLMFSVIPASSAAITVEDEALGTRDLNLFDDLEYSCYWYPIESQLGGASRPDIALGEAGSINSDRHTFTGGYPAVNTPSFIGWA
jgi:hypothetical protein